MCLFCLDYLFSKKYSIIFRKIALILIIILTIYLGLLFVILNSLYIQPSIDQIDMDNIIYVFQIINNSIFDVQINNIGVIDNEGQKINCLDNIDTLISGKTDDTTIYVAIPNIPTKKLLVSLTTLMKNIDLKIDFNNEVL